VRRGGAIYNLNILSQFVVGCSAIYLPLQRGTSYGTFEHSSDLLITVLPLPCKLVYHRLEQEFLALDDLNDSILKEVNGLQTQPLV